MRFFVGVTDGDWFEHLAAMPGLDEVNFWRPSGQTSFRAIKPGELFLFKLHSPRNFIVGGGHFVTYSRLPVSVAWLAFGEKNGVRDLVAFRQLVDKYRRRSGSIDPSPDPVIGCTVLTEPFFWPRDAWIPVPKDWSRNIVQGKTYSTSEPAGKQLWYEVQQRLKASEALALLQGPQDRLELPDGPRYGAEYLTRARLAQGAFRVLVTDAYNRRCAITAERTLPVLEAAHIKPYALSGGHAVSNGLLLRADLHILFDRGYLTVDPEHRVAVSRKIRDEYENGREYYALHGRPLSSLPGQAEFQPDRLLLTWHNENVFAP